MLVDAISTSGTTVNFYIRMQILTETALKTNTLTYKTATVHFGSFAETLETG